MFDPRMLLDALMGAVSRTGGAAQPGPGAAASGSAEQSRGLPPKLSETVQQVTGQTPEQLLGKARGVIEQNPRLAQAAAIGLAGLLFGSRRPGRGLPGTLARLGGLALIGGIAYKAFQSSQAGKTLLAGQSGSGASGGSGPSASTGSAAASLDVPEGSNFHPVSQTEDDALLFLRTMVAAAACDGQIAESERATISRGLTEAGIDAQATGWLERELAAPADVEELAAGVTSPEKAAQVYAAARITIDPDTLQEREFLRQLSEALDLDPAVRDQIDGTAAALRG
jgi:uncharacterized membrane protein YebE (DUF533 family)